MERLVRDAMQTKVVTVHGDLPLHDLERVLLRSGVTSAPVVSHEGALEGVVSRSDVVRQLSLEQSLAELGTDAFRDQASEDWAEESLEAIAAALGQRLAHLTAADLMIRDVITATPDESLIQAARRLLEHRIHRLPVLDGGRLVGILGSLDFVAEFTRDGDRASE
jgi:CBS domain-containing protein